MEVSGVENVKEVVRILLNNCSDIEKIILKYYEDDEMIETFKHLENILRNWKKYTPLIIHADCNAVKHNFLVRITHITDSESDSCGKNLYEKSEISEKNHITDFFNTYDEKCLIENIELYLSDY